MCSGAASRQTGRIKIRLFSHYWVKMKTKLRSRWNVTPQEAVRLQLAWSERVETQDRFGSVQYVAGAGMAFDVES